MHRSGTSLLTRLLNLYGCDLPRTLLDANEANSEGYWEPAPVVDLNDALLNSAGSVWHDWRPFNSAWYQSPRYEEYLERAGETLRSEFGRSSLFVLKDPRICRIAPFWLDALERENIAARAVVPLRHPALVARSLAVRDHIAEPIGQLLWMRHVLDAEQASRGRLRCFLTYTQMLENWQDLPDRVGITSGIVWPRLDPLTRTEQAAFVNPDMAHQETALQGQPSLKNLPDAVARTWQILSAWAVSGEQTDDYPLLDRLHAELNSAAELMAEVVVVSMNTQWLSNELQHKIAEQTEKLDVLGADLASRSAEAGRLAAAKEEDEAQFLSRIAALDRDLAETRRSLEAATNGKAETDALTSELQGKLNLAESNLRQRYAECDHLRAEQAQLAAELERAAAGNGARAERIAELESALANAQARASQTEHLAQSLKDMQNACKTQDQRIARLTEELQKTRLEADRAQREVAEREQNWLRTEAELAQNGERLSRLLNEQRDIHESEAREHRKQASELRQRLDQLDGQNRLFDQLLFEERHRAQFALEQQQWLAAVGEALLAPSKWWVKYLPSAFRERWVRKRLARKGLFDPAAYLRRNQDVAGSGMDPLRHYIRHGIAEGRPLQ
jgi:hypothetical protein